jgi:hypothetical protein
MLEPIPTFKIAPISLGAKRRPLQAPVGPRRLSKAKWRSSRQNREALLEIAFVCVLWLACVSTTSFECLSRDSIRMR